MKGCLIHIVIQRPRHVKDVGDTIPQFQSKSIAIFHKTALEHGSKRQAMYIKRNIEARLCNHCCSGKAISIAYSTCVFVDFVIQHVMVIRHTVICGLSDSTIFFHTVSTLFSKEKITEHKMSFDFL